jgi:hypothetical protein
VFLVFDAPENDGGAPITTYRAYVDGELMPNQGYGLDLNFNVGLGAWELELYEEGSILDENLVEISAVNAAGEGPKASVTLNPA